MPKQQICENLQFDSAKDKLILTIKQEKSFVFENALDNACKQWLEEGKPQDELEKFIKKQNDKYFINKPLEVCAKNTSDTESTKSTQESSECDEESKESKRKIIYLQDELSFKNCVFNGEVHFKYIVFALGDFQACDSGNAQSKSAQPLRIDFQHCKFHKKVYFTNCEFNGNVFFNHAVFERYADFHESIFNGVVSFYNAEFKYAPNFSTCVFQNLQATNFINVKIESLDFDKIKEFINECENDETYKNEKQLLRDSKEIDNATNKHKIRYASNARDSFRTIKNVLIANNNLLDACAWHKLELYAKEHEIALKTPKCFSKEWLERVQLCFYRHTSAHHTDLLKILSWFVVLVGGFATLSFMANYLIDLAKWASIFWIIAVCVMFLKANLFSALALLNCIPCFLLLAWNPKYIFGVANLFGNDKCQNDIFLNLILSLYSIAFILVVFSLQKTARKNSIIPN